MKPTVETNFLRETRSAGSFPFVVAAALMLLASGGPRGFAQGLPEPPERPTPEGLRIHPVLFEIVEGVEAQRALAPVVNGDVVPAAARAAAAARGLTMQNDGRVLVEMIGPPNASASEDIPKVRVKGMELNNLGISLGKSFDEVPNGRNAVNVANAGPAISEPLTAFDNRIEAFIPVDQLVDVAQSLPNGYRIAPVFPLNHDDVAGEGPAATNSDSYTAGGQNGAGITIGIIDAGYENLTAARNNGDAPQAGTYTLLNYTTSAFETSGTHGTGCVEAVYDHAPGAMYRIYKIDSLTDLGTAVADAITNGVDILSHSLSFYNEGWADDSGTACTAANNASSNGILFFTSAGNRAESHYSGPFADSNTNDFQEFSGTDETISIFIPDNGGGNFYLSWDNAASDFDLYLLDSTASTVVASSTNSGNTFENFYFQNTSGSNQVYHLAVHHYSGPTAAQLEVFDHNASFWYDNKVAAGSTTSPSNATGPLVVSVGAVDTGNFGQANGSTPIESYSSQGPSNSGMTLPDISGPTNTTGFTYPGGFGGTSSATPNAAGATAAFWSQNTNLTASGIAWLIREQAGLWRDWGTAGDDNVYGRGGLQLVDFESGTRWLARSFPGTTDDGTVPFHTLQAGYDDTPNNGRLLIWGDTYPESANLNTPGKQVVIEPVPDTGNAILGN